MRTGQLDFGLSCPECFHSVAAAGAALVVPENSEEKRLKESKDATANLRLSLRFTVRGLD